LGNIGTEEEHEEKGMARMKYCEQTAVHWFVMALRTIR